MTGFQTHFHLSFDCNHHRSHCIITLFYLKASTRLDSTRFNHIHSQTVSKREWAKWCNSLYNVSVTAFDKRNRLEYLLCAHWSGGGGEYKCIRIVLLVYQHNQTHCEYHYQLLFRHFRCDAARDISYIDYSVGLRIISHHLFNGISGQNELDEEWNINGIVNMIWMHV